MEEKEDMEKEVVRIGLISFYRDKLEIYKKYLKKYNIELECYDTFNNYLMGSKNKQYNGFMIDSQSVITGSTRIKQFIYSLEEGFPVVNIGVDQDGKVVVLMGAQTRGLSHREYIDWFINERCKNHPPRFTRSTIRKNYVYNVFVAFREKGPFKKGNLVNLSEGGCFLYCTFPKEKGDRLWVKIYDLDKDTEVQGEIRYIIPWGRRENIFPGYGVQFLNLPEKLTAIIREEVEV